MQSICDNALISCDKWPKTVVSITEIHINCLVWPEPPIYKTENKDFPPQIVI